VVPSIRTQLRISTGTKNGEGGERSRSGDYCPGGQKNTMKGRSEIEKTGTGKITENGGLRKVVAVAEGGVHTGYGFKARKTCTEGGRLSLRKNSVPSEE